MGVFVKLFIGLEHLAHIPRSEWTRVFNLTMEHDSKTPARTYYPCGLRIESDDDGEAFDRLNRLFPSFRKARHHTIALDDHPHNTYQLWEWKECTAGINDTLEPLLGARTNKEGPIYTVTTFFPDGGEAVQDSGPMLDKLTIGHHPTNSLLFGSITCREYDTITYYRAWERSLIRCVLILA